MLMSVQSLDHHFFIHKLTLAHSYNQMLDKINLMMFKNQNYTAKDSIQKQYLTHNTEISHYYYLGLR